MRCDDPVIAAYTAQANATEFNFPYVVFRDSSGYLRVEREWSTRNVEGLVFYPDVPINSVEAKVTS